MAKPYPACLEPITPVHGKKGEKVVLTAVAKKTLPPLGSSLRHEAEKQSLSSHENKVETNTKTKMTLTRKQS